MKNIENGPAGQRSTAAGRLLTQLTADGSITLSALAKVLQVSEQGLTECRDGKGRLEPRVQLNLANLAPVMSPRLGVAARRLNAQALAALEYEAHGAETRHSSYPRSQFR